MKIWVEKYHFDISNGLEAAAYSNLKADLKARGLKKFRAIATSHKEVSLEGAFTVETGHLFNNQSHTEEGHRVFDWREEYMSQRMNQNIRRGYYIKEGFEALQEARDNRLVCGFCGHQYDKEGAPVICEECIVSPYLEADNLPLLKLAAVTEKRQPLTEEEAEKLTADFKQRQIRAQKTDIEKTREEITKKHKKAIEVANVEYTGFLWLLDKGINTENCIFYSNSKTFCFGWRSALSPEIVAGLKVELEHFPFNIEFKESEK